MKKRFHVAAIVSLHSGWLLSQHKDNNGFADMHDLAEHLADGPVWTHQLGRVATEMRSVLEQQFPRLTECDPRPFFTSKPVTQAMVQAATEHAASILGEWLEVDNETSSMLLNNIDPLEELERMVPKEKIIQVQV